MDIESFHQHIVNLMNPDKAIREGSEGVLAAFLRAAPKNYQALETIATNEACPDSSRQMSVILLRQYMTGFADEKDRSKGRRFFSSMNPEDIAHILTFSVDLIFRSPNAAVKRAAIVLLAKFCGCCQSTDFEHILTSLTAFLVEGQDANFSLACKCICEIASDCQSAEEYEKVFILVQTVYEHSRNIFLVCPRDNITLLRYIIRYKRMCLQTIGFMTSQAGLDESQEHSMRVFIYDWGRILIDWAGKVTDLNTLISSEASCYVEIFQSLITIFQCFQGETAPEMIQSIISCAWQILAGLKDHYIANYVFSSEAEGEDSGYTSDGDRIDADVVMSQVFELFVEGTYVMLEEDLNTLFGSEWTLLIDTVVSLMQLPSAMVTKYVEDGNEFVSNVSDDFSEGVSIRASGAEILQLLKKPEYVFLYIQKELSALYPSFQSSTPQQQVQIEALLFALESINSKDLGRYSFAKYITSEGSKFSPTDVGSSLSLIFQSIILEPYFSEFLKARAISLFSGLRHLFGVDYTMSILDAALRYLSSPGPVAFHLQLIENFITPLFAAPRQSEQSFHDELISKVTVASVHELLSAILTISDSCSEETSQIPMFAVKNLVKLFANGLDSDFISKISEAVIGKLYEKRNDSLFVVCTESIYSSLVSVPSGVGILIVRNCLIPFVQSVFSQNDQISRLYLWKFASKVIGQLFSCRMEDAALVQRNSIKNEILQFFVQVLSTCSEPDIIREILIIFNRVLSSCVSENSYVDAISPDIITSMFSTGCSVISKVLSVCNDEADSMEDRAFKDCISPAMGLFSLLITLNKDIVDKSSITSLVGQSLQIFREDSTTKFAKTEILNAMIHLAPRCPATIFGALNAIQEMGGFENIFMELLTYWTDTHKSLDKSDCKYSIRISTLGLLEVAKILGNSTNNSQLIAYIIQVVCDPIEAGASLSDSFQITVNDDRSESEFDIDEDEYDEDGGFDDDDDGDDDGFEFGGEGAGGGGGRGGGDNPFADAREYYGEDYEEDGDFNFNPKVVFTRLTERILFHPIQLDPMSAVDMDEYFRQSLQALGLDTSGSAAATVAAQPAWFDALSEDAKAKIIAIFST